MTVEWENDIHDRNCLVFRKNKGKINQEEVKEYLRSKMMYGVYVHMIDAGEEQEPQGMWDEETQGDTWFLYEPYEIKQEIIERANT